MLNVVNDLGRCAFEHGLDAAARNGAVCGLMVHESGKVFLDTDRVGVGCEKKASARRAHLHVAKDSACLLYTSRCV